MTLDEFQNSKEYKEIKHLAWKYNVSINFEAREFPLDHFIVRFKLPACVADVAVYHSDDDSWSICKDSYNKYNLSYFFKEESEANDLINLIKSFEPRDKTLAEFFRRGGKGV